MKRLHSRACAKSGKSHFRVLYPLHPYPCVERLQPAPHERLSTDIRIRQRINLRCRIYATYVEVNKVIKDRTAREATYREHVLRKLLPVLDQAMDFRRFGETASWVAPPLSPVMMV